MFVRRRCGWELPETAVTPEARFLDRRAALALAGGAAAGAGLALLPSESAAQRVDQVPDPSGALYPAPRNARFADAGRPVTPEAIKSTYNNFYEFGSHKQIWRAAQALPIRPWEIKIDGMVERPFTIGIDDLLKQVALEERVHRFRCVEAWAATVPWTGFPMKRLVEIAKPLGSARYLRFETFHNAAVAGGQRQSWYPWPYVEGVTIEEATNELALIATGAYGKPLARQAGAPIRVILPWKYGFKSVKSIVRVAFTDQRPRTFWEAVQGSEYGFWANVNPDVPHPRWSQASERLLDDGSRAPTRIYNGYGEWVAPLYAGKQGERLFM
jgi:sulfoxide reductase catalytic subunit YedY